jgi:hypothetical protein
MKEAVTKFHWPIIMFRCIFIVFPTPLSKKKSAARRAVFFPSCKGVQVVVFSGFSGEGGIIFSPK